MVDLLLDLKNINVWQQKSYVRDVSNDHFINREENMILKIIIYFSLLKVASSCWDTSTFETLLKKKMKIFNFDHENTLFNNSVFFFILNKYIFLRHSSVDMCYIVRNNVYSLIISELTWVYYCFKKIQFYKCSTLRNLIFKFKKHIMRYSLFKINTFDSF